MNDAEIKASFIKKVLCFIKKYAFVFPSLLIEVFTFITMSASLGLLDTALLGVSLAFALLSVLSALFSDGLGIKFSFISSAVSLIALIADVILSARAFTMADLAVMLGACVFAVHTASSSGRRRLLSRSGCTVSAILCVAGTAAIFWASGVHFIVQDPLLVILCHLCSAFTLAIAYRRPRLNKVSRIAISFAIPIAAFLILEFLTHNPFMDINAAVFLVNVLLFLLFGWLMTFIIGRSAPAMIITVLLPLILGLVSYFTVEFRGTPLFPWDLASYGIAATVLGGYDLTIPPTVALVCSSAVLVCTSAVVFGFSFRKRISLIVRPIAALLIICVLISAGAYLQTDRAIEELDLYPYLFVPHHLYKTNGFTVSFLMNLRYTSVDKPDGYSSEGVLETAESYASDSISKTENRPNVIVIMNESFADMRSLCDFETNTEYVPFISSLEENTLKGDVHVSIVGGNTPNSEFEFLTGMTMGFLPSGSIPYQQFIKGERPTLATQLDSLGYHTVAMHPYWAEGWKRELVYPLMGFEEMHFLDYDTYGSFNDYPRIRDYISDEGVYDKIRLAYEENGDGEPLFVFAVTMQNHSGYSQSYDNFVPSVEVTGLESNFEVSTYMSLVRESDKAFGGLIEYFKDADEPTVILMFGDHQPNDSIARPLMDKAGMVYDDGNIESSEKRYTVPYVMWANYDLDTETAADELSLNYLSALLMDAADLPMTASQKLARELMEDFPIITGRCLKTKDGKTAPVSDHKLYDKLKAYSHLQYCYLFDSGNMPDGFWNLNK